MGNGQYTEDEHRNLVALERNLKLTRAFLFKGTKEVAAIGEIENLDLYNVHIGSKKKKIIKAKEEEQDDL